MTAPDMVGVIAATLRGHYVGIDPRHSGLRCECGQGVETDDATHQARAVLAAISEAGTVEWGVAVGKTAQTYAYESEESARRDAQCQCCTTVSRLTFPWTAVEG